MSFDVFPCYRSRDRDERRSNKSRSESRDRRRNGNRASSRSRSRSRSRERKPEKSKAEPIVIDLEANEVDTEGKTEDEIAMMKLMGFAGFDSTKGKKVNNNDSGAVHHVVVRKYRQYMNRRGGFNRPLDFVN